MPIPADIGGVMLTSMDLGAGTFAGRLHLASKTVPAPGPGHGVLPRPRPSCKPAGDQTRIFRDRPIQTR